jgi:UDP-glucose 4-epimerase
MRFVVTGGMGFFGSILCEHLVDRGHDVLSLDLLADTNSARRYKNIQLDLRDFEALKAAVVDFERDGKVNAIFHVAALLAHVTADPNELWSANVDGTKNVMECAKQLSIARVVFTSTNCVFSTGFTEPVNEQTATQPIEIYGKSKLAAEEIITSYKDVSSVIVRCPTIIAAGRLGLLTILFDFVREGRRLYVVGDGSNRYSFISADDLADACLLAAQSSKSGLYNIGSDNVPSMRQLYSSLMQYAGKKPRIVSIPEAPTVMALKILNKLGLSPLGPYHYRMLAANFVFDTSKIKSEIEWRPTKTNTEILCSAYQYYIDNLDSINNATNVSAHHSKAKAGILNLLRLIS